MTVPELETLFHADGLNRGYQDRGLKLKFLSKVSGANVVVLENVARTSGCQYHSISDDVSAITDTQGLADVVIRDEDSDTCFAECVMAFRISPMDMGSIPAKARRAT
ncbi:MAG: hypothetical protein CM1200mP41_00010 [Gammaproteobacteria bacterium]|nr:MAG: hypothetical protein CM1200mP41_00010 [Gammaproteobacteria bacterium]